MALLNPINALFASFLFVVTIPLALFAGITTTLAFSVLIFRALLVYVDIALSLVPQSLHSLRPRLHAYEALHAAGGPRHSSSSGSIHSNNSPSPTLTPLRRRRRRPSSSASLISNSSAADGSLGLIPSIGPERDFEGVGGWRVGGKDELWTTVNSRFETPDRRHHYRSASGGGPTTPGEGSYLMMKHRARSPEAKAARPSMSPNSSRARTPTGARISFIGLGNSDGYFPLTTSPKAVKKLSGQAVE